MRVALIAIAGGVGLLALLESRHASITAGLSVSGPSPYGAPPPRGYSAPQVAFGGQVVDNLAMSGIGLATQDITKSLANAGSSFAQAIPFVGAAVGAIVSSLLAAHAARLQGATTENEQVARAVPSFYSTLVSIVNHWNAGAISRADAVNGLRHLDAATYAALRQFVGKPGTAWNSTQSGVCDKTCTVGCCIYNTWLHPDIYGAGAKRGVAQLLTVGSQSQIWNGGRKQCAGIPTNTYKFPGYPAFSIVLRAP